MQSTAHSLEGIRKDFPVLERKVRDNKRLVYLDNAATTPLLPEVIERMTELMKDTFGEEQSLKIIEMQSQWVNQLNKYFRDQGEDSTIENLKKKGVSQANKGALKRWREGQNMMLLAPIISL